MSTTPVTATAAEPITTVSQARVPAAVRNGSSAVKHDYSAAQSFETMLLQQLSQSLAQSSGLGGEGEEGSEGEGSAGAGSGELLGSLLPQTLAQSVQRAGGLGLAGQLLDALDPAARDGANAAASLTTGGGLAA
jgi:Rod binding domain-containing protein